MQDYIIILYNNMHNNCALKKTTSYGGVEELRLWLEGIVKVLPLNESEKGGRGANAEGV